MSMTDGFIDRESEAIARCTRAIDGLIGGEAKGRVLRYLNDRYGWALPLGERGVTHTADCEPEKGDALA
jgi:hypothetical protein